MNSFRSHRLRDLTLPTSTAWSLTDIAEAKEKQELCVRQSPKILKALRDTATIQSAESSNRIEGVTGDRDRSRLLKLDALQAEVDTQKRLQAESGHCPQPALAALLPAILANAFKGEL